MIHRLDIEGVLEKTTDVKRSALLKYVDLQFMINCRVDYSLYSFPVRKVLPDFIERVIDMLNAESEYNINLID